MPQFPYLVSDLLYDIVETVNCKFSRILTDSRILTATSLCHLRRAPPNQ